MKSNKLKVIDGVNEELYCPHCNKLLLEKIDFDNENLINPLNLKCEHTKYIAMNEAGIIFMSDYFIDQGESKGYEIEKFDEGYTIFNKDEDEDVYPHEINEILNDDSLSNYIVQEKNTGGPSYMQINIYYGVSISQLD